MNILQGNMNYDGRCSEADAMSIAVGHGIVSP